MPVFTLAQLRTKIYERVDNNQNLYTLPEVDRVINECLRTVALFTGFYRTTVESPAYTVANRIIYAIPTGIFVPLIVSLDGRQLQKISFKKLVRLKRNWATDNTTRSGRVEYWAPIGISQFVLYPKDGAGGRTVTITGLAEPPLLVNVGDVIVLENEYVEVITEYGEHILPLKEGGKIFADGSLNLNAFYSKMRQRKIYQSMKLPKYWLLEAKPEPAQ